MTSEEHADGVETIVASLRNRILGVGADQYDDGSGTQRFENRPLNSIVTDAVEEIDDLIVYLSQIRMRLTGINLPKE
jgi:hypothetical protein